MITIKNIFEISSKPFLKWPGGKHKISGHIYDLIKPLLSTQDHFIEPFAGSCSMSLEFYKRDIFSSFLVNDANSTLIDLYKHIQSFESEKELESKFIGGLKNTYFDEPGSYNTKEWYEAIRAGFNGDGYTTQQRCWAFLYLNRHCFNGLVRYNKKGKFNTPFGRYSKISFPEKEIRNFYRWCAHGNVEVKFESKSFVELLSSFNDIKDSVIYCDPPYFPLSSTANFTAYCGSQTEDEWVTTDGSQKRLVEAARALVEGNTSNLVAISNHDVPEFRNLVENNKCKEYHTFDVARTISCNSQNRKPVKESLAIFY